MDFLLAQSAGESGAGPFDWLKAFVERDPEMLGSAMAFIGFCFAVATVLIVKAWIKHRERLAMIEKGMRPDESFSGLVVGEKKSAQGQHE